MIGSSLFNKLAQKMIKLQDYTAKEMLRGTIPPEKMDVPLKDKSKAPSAIAPVVPKIAPVQTEPAQEEIKDVAPIVQPPVIEKPKPINLSVQKIFQEIVKLFQQRVMKNVRIDISRMSTQDIANLDEEKFAEYFDEYKEFTKSLRRNVEKQPMGRQKEIAQEALSLFVQKFDTSSAEQISTFVTKDQGMQAVKYPNLTEGEIRSRIRDYAKTKAKKGRNAIGDAIRYLENQPEFLNNDHNNQILQSLRYLGQHKTLRPVDLNSAERGELASIFFANYLEGAENASNLKRFLSAMKQVGVSEEEVDPFTFVTDELFNPNEKNRELFLSFFANKKSALVQSEVDKLMQDNIFSDEEQKEYDEFKMQQSSANDIVLGFIQNRGHIFVDAIRRIMEDKQDESGLHNAFFDWVLYEIVKSQGRKTKLEEEESETGFREETSGKGTVSAQREFGTAVAADFGIHTCEDLPPVGKNQPPTSKHYECLKSDWQKLDSYLTDILNKMQEKYDALPATQENSADKFFLLQKKILWGRILESCRASINNVLRSEGREGAKLTDERAIKIINRDWRDLFTALHWADKPFDPTAEDIQSAVASAVNDGLKPNAEKAYGDLLVTGAESYDSLDSKKQSTMRWNLQSKASINMQQLEDIFMDTEILAKHGTAPAVTFLDILKLRPELYTMGILFSKKNRRAFEYKVDFLLDLIDRGVNIGKTKEQIEAMSPNQILTTFESVEGIIDSVYGEPTDLDRYILSDQVSEADFSQIARAANVSKITSKADFAAVSKDKATKQEKQAIKEQFLATNLSLYYIQNRTVDEAFDLYLGKAISLSIEAFENQRASVISQQNLTAQEFLEACGIANKNTIEQDIDKMRRSHKVAIARKFFPALHTLYRRRNIEIKSLMQRVKKGDHLDIQAILGDILQHEGQEIAAEKPPITNKMSKFLAKLFDAVPESQTYASVDFYRLRKLAISKKFAKLQDIRLRAKNLGVDMSSIDMLMHGNTNGRNTR